MMNNHGRMGSNHIPGGYDDNHYQAPKPPELISPEPQRHMPEMSDQIQHGLQHMSLDYPPSTMSLANEYQQEISGDFRRFSSNDYEAPNLSPFPKLVNPPANIPPSDEDFEATLWNARTLVLDSNDAEMQLAWAADALIYVGVCADNEERIAAAKPGLARPSTPHIEHTLKEDAMNIVTFLSTQHHPKAEFLRGMWLEWGRYGQREDKKEAFRCYSRAADKGYARAEYRIGMLYESSNDAPKALRHYHRGVDAGDSASCYRLGMMTLRGQHGQQQDWPRAVSLIKESADTADENAAQGAYVYGMLLARQLPQINVPETFLPPDQAKARMYLEKAAFLKFAKAQLKMGSAYELGDMGCDFDPALSMHYYALASKQGEPEADMALSKWFLVGHEGVFAKNEDLAFKYAERAAATGLATAEFALGYFNEIGMCVAVNLDKSVEWYKKAATHGSEDAKGRINALANQQVLSKGDHEKVALTRIKSMHNSMHGGRPPRLQQQAPMPTIPANGHGLRSPNSVHPPRTASAVPYPVDDGPPPRSSSAVHPRAPLPYPQESSPTSAYPQHSPVDPWHQQQPPRSVSTSYMEQRPSYQDQRPPYQDQRPNYQQPAPYQSQGHPPPQRQYDQQYGAPPNHTQAGPPIHHPPPQRRQVPDQRVASSPQFQQGFQQGPPGRGGPYNQGAPSPRLPPPQQQHLGPGYQPQYQGGRHPQGGSPMMQQGRMPPSQHLPQSHSAPNFNQSRPPQQQYQQSRPQQQYQQQPSQQYQQSRPPPANIKIPPKEPIQAPAPSPKPPPPKGPKTFDEMGVPTKQNGTCVMM